MQALGASTSDTAVQGQAAQTSAFVETEGVLTFYAFACLITFSAALFIAQLALVLLVKVEAVNA